MKLNFILLILIVFMQINANAKAKNYFLQSPDKKICLEVRVDKSVTWDLKIDGQQVLDQSGIAMYLEKEIIGLNPKVSKSITKEINEISSAVVPYKFSKVTNHCNELLLLFRSDYAIRFRAYNKGIAYRIEINRKGSIVVRNEKCEFNFASDCSVLFPEEENFVSQYERLYIDTTLKAISIKQFCSLPVLVTESNGIRIGITETGQSNYPCMFLKGTGSNKLNAIFPPVPEEMDQTDIVKKKVLKVAPYIAKTEVPRFFPWRCLMLEREDKKLLENNLPYILAEKNVLEDVSWIKPGKVAWEWWSDHNIFGVDFKSGINTETYKYYIDFAAKFGLEYILLDGGWSDRVKLDIPSPGVDIREIIRYGKSKGVGVILWALWEPLYNDLDKYLDVFADWGAVGIKVDGICRADQLIVRYYEEIANAAAKRKMLVDFHGAFKPNGLQRKYPNVINFEGVLGNEHNKWNNNSSPNDASPKHNLTIPFTRMLAGPMDYTPGAMRNETAKGFNTNYSSPMSKGTRCQQAGMYIVYEAPLQMLCDNASLYLREPEYTRFISKIPTTWDETVALKGKVKEYVVVARKNGDSWYIGGMTDWTSRNFNIDISFIGDGEWSIEYVADGINADRYPSDYILRKEKLNSKKLKITMAPGGGYAAILKRIK